MRERRRQVNHADKQKEHQSEQGGRQAYELPESKTGGCGEQHASNKIRPEPVRRHVRRDHIPHKLGAAEMFGREYGEWNGDEDSAQSDELVPAASRAELFAKYKNS